MEAFQDCFEAQARRLTGYDTRGGCSLVRIWRQKRRRLERRAAQRARSWSMQSSSPPWRRRSVALSPKRRSLHDLAVGSAQRKPKEDVVCNDRRHELCFPHLRPQKDLIGSSKKIAQVFWWLVEAPTRPWEIGASKALLDLEDPTRGWSIAQSQDSNSGPTATALRKLSRRCRKTSFFIDPCDPFQHHCDFSILRDQPPAEYLSYVIVIMFTTSQSMPEFALREGQF